jgi:hypothetical protein
MTTDKTANLYRVKSDAILGAGMELRGGEVVPPDALGEYAEGLKRCGAIEELEPVQNDERRE